MTIKQLAWGGGAVALAVAAFVGWRVAAPWETFRFAGYEVRRNRITERAELKVGDSWQRSLNAEKYDPATRNLPPEDLRRIQLRNFQFGTRGYFCGEMRVTGDKPVDGRLAFNITVRDKRDGKRRDIESERSLRCHVTLRPGETQRFLIQTDMTLPNANEKFEVKLVRIRADE